MTKKTRIYLSDLQRFGVCMEGTKQWVESKGLDWKKIVKEGLTINRLKKLDDGYANSIIKSLKREGVL